MKIKNIFKKSEKKIAKTNVQKLEKKQLEKVIGGTDPVVVTSSSRKSGSVIYIDREKE